jgi:peroxiredoxin
LEKGDLRPFLVGANPERKIRRKVPILWQRFAIVIFAGFLFMPVLCAGEEAALPEGKLPSGLAMNLLVPGASAPMFRIKDVDGNVYKLSEHVREKTHLIIFWSVFCEPCRNILAKLNKVEVKYRGRGLEILAISMDGEPLRSVVSGFARQEGYHFKILVDEFNENETFEVAGRYGVMKIPSLFLLKKGGEITYMGSGSTGTRTLMKKVEAAVSP